MGAGDMGTALVTPLAHNGHEVRLWGTERDGAIIEALRAGNPHPRLGISVPADVQTFTSEETAVAFQRGGGRRRRDHLGQRARGAESAGAVTWDTLSRS